VAIEVSEVVCERAAQLTAQGNEVYRVWKDGELATHVARLLSAKDGKAFNGGPYAEIIACLFTDEPALSSEYALSQLNDVQFGGLRQLTSGFLLFSYDPGTKSYPVCPLRRRHMTPNPAVNPDAPSAWPRSYQVLNRRRAVQRFVGAPVTLYR
jgi:hypothetical protein